MKISRRKFLLMGVATTTLGAVYLVSKWRWGDPSSVIIAILERRVGHLRVDQGVFQMFAREYLDFRKQYRQELSWLSGFAMVLRYISPYALLKMGSGFRRLEDNVVSQFLMSTDFFMNKANEDRQIKYLSFYDPYIAVCRNPFWEF